MLVPLGLVAAWSQGVFAIGAGGLLKLRLLYGALRLEPDETRHQGSGPASCARHRIGIDRIVDARGRLLRVGHWRGTAARRRDLRRRLTDRRTSSCFSSRCSSPRSSGTVYFKRLQQWTDARLHMTQDLVERMVGHRTRLAQEPASRWHEGEDELLERYSCSRRGWTGSAWRSGRSALLDDDRDARARAIVRHRPNLSGMLAVGLGAILLAFGALARLTTTFAYVAGAPLDGSRSSRCSRPRGGRRPLGCADLAAPFRAGAAMHSPLVMAKDLAFRFRDRAEPALRDCSFRISYGDRLHLSGPSGSGKSTLVSLLTGLRTPAVRRSAARRARSGDARRGRLAATRGCGAAVP